MTDPSIQPITMLIAALGGEGGGVLTNWVVTALESHGLVVQSTSIPGVAQRTGKADALFAVSILPVFMLVSYIGLIGYYRSKGGYKPVEL